ncbi:MAG: MoxR family ATPase [bacterium]|jgi:MoxR-like ATPase|nr:MoxR family ATPase [bacterium]
MIDIAKVKETSNRLKTEVKKVIVGQDEVIDLILQAMLIRGHILLEGVPGTAKTLTVKTLAHSIGIGFRRLQMTPDLMPSDIVGTNIYDMKTCAFKVQKGPIFTDFVLADEINRAPAKTQSAMLECMEERQVTIEGTRFALSPIFMVLATMNPLEYEGTYPLPEAQLDRFIFKILVPYPDTREENSILDRFEEGFRADEFKKVGIERVTDTDEILQCQEGIRLVKTKDSIIEYITDIVRSTRSWKDLLVGGGPRASIGLLLSSKAVALMDGRDYVTPDDVKKMVYPVLRHRIILKPEAEIEGISPDECLDAILTQVKVPR